MKTKEHNVRSPGRVVMVSADEALRLILEATPTLGKQKVSLLSSLGRTVAKDVVAEEDIPPFGNSSMDGYAVISSDTERASAAIPRELLVIGESSAGKVCRRHVKPGTAVRVMTGGKIPEGADTVVPIEAVKLSSARRIIVGQPAPAGQHVRHAGEDVRRGETVVHTGTLIEPATIGVLASLGTKHVEVFKKPRVNILATGNELVEHTSVPAEGQIRNSNSVVLAGYVQLAGGEPRTLGIAADKKNRIRDLIRRSPEADILLITGGVSVGRYDFVKEVLRGIGVQMVFQSVNIKPGKPLAFGLWGNTLVFGLPGNPVSSSVTFLQFVRPAMWRMTGRISVQPLRFPAVLEEGIAKGDGKRYFLRGVARQIDGGFHVRTTGSQSSGVMSSMARANCLIVIPEQVTSVKQGETVEVEML